MSSRSLAIPSIVLIVLFSYIPVLSNAQRIWAAFFPNNYGAAGRLIWKYNDPPQAYTFDRLPAITVTGEDGGEAFYLGKDAKGSYLSLNGKILYWDGEHLTPVQKLPDHMVEKNDLDLVIDAPFDANATKMTMSPRIDYKYARRGGDPFLPWPCGRSGKVSWAYNAGGTPVSISFPFVWIEGNQQMALYHGYNYQGSYLTDLKSGKLLKWDGKTLTELSALPDFLIFSRDYYMYTYNAVPLLARNFGPPNKYNQPGGPAGDPYMPMRGNQEVGGRWGISSGISWYYPLQEPTTIPIVTLHDKNGVVPAVYQGYDGLGAYLIVNGKSMVWDGDRVYAVGVVPTPTSLLNVPPATSAAPATSASAASSAAGKGDPYFVLGGTGNGMISWEYEVNSSFPTIYMGMRGKMYQLKADYHGYDEHGAYFTYNDPKIGNCELMFDGKGNVIPIGKIPPNLKNAH